MSGAPIHRRPAGERVTDEPVAMTVKAKYRVGGNFKVHLHGADHSGGNGRIGRRKARGWRKGWANEYRSLMGYVGNALPRVTCFGRSKGSSD